MSYKVKFSRVDSKLKYYTRLWKGEEKKASCHVAFEALLVNYIYNAIKSQNV